MSKVKTEKKTNSKKPVSKKKLVLKILIIVVSVLVMVGVCVAFLPFFKGLRTAEGRLAFQNEIQSLGFKGFLLIYLLESVQILLIILPGEPIELLYGMCYGGLLGTIYLTITVFINTVIVYAVVKKFGRRILVFFFDEEKIEKVEKSKLFNDPGKATNLMTILFFIPGTPKDLLLYIGPLLPIKWWVFVLISTFVRLPSVVTSTVAGAGITNNNFAMMAWMYGGVAVSIVLVELILHFRKSKHTKDIKEAMKEIK